MKRIALIIVTSLLAMVSNAQNISQIRHDVEVLSSDSLQGRYYGTPERRKAQDYIINSFVNSGLTTLRQNFEVNGRKSANIAALIKSSEPSNEYIVVGAHYDHLGTKLKNGKEEIYHGADDNASGTAMLLEIARLFSQNSTSIKRNVILVAFDAEEVGLCGSEYFASDPLFAQNASQIKLMLNLDMVGWLKEGELNVSGVGMLKNWEELFEKANTNALKLSVKSLDKSVFTDSDFTSFAKRQIPSISFTTGTKSPYHKPEDTADKIDYQGMEKVSSFLYNLICEAANSPSLTFSGKIASRHSNKSSRFAFGVGAGYGSACQNYHFGNITGRNGNMYQANLFSQYNFSKIYALRLSVSVQRDKTKRAEGQISQTKLSLPLVFVLQTPLKEAVGVDFRLGMFYDYCFDADFKSTGLNFDTFSAHDMGLVSGFGFRIAGFGLDMMWKTGLANLNKGTENKISSSSFNIGLTYYFKR